MESDLVVDTPLLALQWNTFNGYGSHFQGGAKFATAAKTPKEAAKQTFEAQAQLIQSVGADIVFLQEVVFKSDDPELSGVQGSAYKTKEEFEAVFGEMYAIGYSHKPSGLDKGLTNVIMLRKDKFDDVTFQAVPTKDEDRPAALALGTYQGKPVAFASCHTSYLKPSENLVIPGLTDIKNALKSHTLKNFIIAGDMNHNAAFLHEKGIPQGRLLTDSGLVKSDSEAKVPFTGSKNKQKGIIDNALLGSNIFPQEATILQYASAEPKGKFYYSDHFPIKWTFIIKPEPKKIAHEVFSRYLTNINALAVFLSLFATILSVGNCSNYNESDHRYEQLI